MDRGVAKTSGTGIGKVLDDAKTMEAGTSCPRAVVDGRDDDAQKQHGSNTALALRGKDRCPLCKSKTTVLNMQHVWSECGACIDDDQAAVVRGSTRASGSGGC